MDLDTSLYTLHSTPPRTPPSPPASTPLPPVTLPSAPRPTVSPSVSRVFQRKQSDAAPTLSGGLDLSVPPTMDSRALGPGGGGASQDAHDTASARDNILNLVSAGQRSLGGNGAASTPSLAMFMGGGTQRRTHRVGTGMTEQEKEETERLEREMAATRAKWGDKGAQNNVAPPSGGISLASLMKGATGGTKAAASPSPVAAATPQGTPTETTTTATAPPKPASPPIVEAKIVSRSPPAEQADEPGPTPASSAPPVSDPESATIPRSASSVLSVNTLTRLQSSNIVADRLKWTEKFQQADPASVPAPISAPPSPEKRRSVVERWGRDAPNSTAPASPVVSRRAIVAMDLFAPREDMRTSPEQIEETAKVEQADEPVTDVVVPKLTHATRDRARPNKSTPRTHSSTSSQAIENAPPASASRESPLTPAAQSLAKSGYTKPTWSAAPISVKDSSKPLSPPPVDDEPASPEVRHTRGVALPGLSGAALKSAPSPRPAPLATPTSPARPSRSEEVSSSDVSSVRAAAMRWGQTAAQRAAEKSEALQALKASYGVKVAPARQVTLPAMQRRDEVEVPAKSRSVEVAASTSARKVEPAPAPTPAPVPTTASALAPAPSLVPANTPRAASPPAPAAPLETASSAPAPATASAPLPLRTSASAERTLADDIVAAVLAPRSVAHLPPGETLSLDVFHLNSPSDDPHALDHNHMLFTSEIVGIVHRAAVEGQGVQTRTWVWIGNEAEETPRTEERIARLAEKTGTEPVVVGCSEEGPDLAEAFAGQLTVCRGRREEFDHLANHMFSVQSHDGGVFVEEVDVSVRTLCSGYASVFSSLGEVYAWLGEGSTDIERHAACEFAESLADGRTVAVLAEGEETALFWHQLAAHGAEYAAANYWRYRPLHPQSATVVRFAPSPSTPFAVVSTLELSPSHVSLIDGGFAEHWVIVPESVLSDKKRDVELALEAAEKLANKWDDRGFPSRTPFHVLLTPSLIPRDLPFLARALNFAPLDEGTSPRKMRVFTAPEAREELLR